MIEATTTLPKDYRTPPPTPPSLLSGAESGALSLTVPFKGTSLSVQVVARGERLRREHVEKVRKYLELAESDLEDDSS